MKKVFIVVLLIAALGIALYYVTRNDETPGKEITDISNQELLIGKWKLDSIVLSKDSASRFAAGITGIVASELMKYQYEFKNNGAIAISVKDSLLEDSSRYEWNRNNQLVWKESPADTTVEVFSVAALNKDSLILQAADSTSLLFTKTKE